MKNEIKIRLCACSDEADESLIGQTEALKRNGISYTELRSVDGKNVSELSEKEAGEICRRLNGEGISVYIKMHDLIKSGELGQTRRVNWIITNWFRTQFYYDSGSWRATWAGEGGGVLMNQCPHQLDLLQWICGMMPVKMRAFCHFGKWHDIEVEDDVTAYMEFENGATGAFITTTADTPGTNRRIVCEKDELTVQRTGIDATEISSMQFWGQSPYM